MKLVLLRIDHITFGYAGTGRYQSRAVGPPRPPRPAAPSAGASSPRPPPATLRRIVLAPPLPKVSYIRIMPLWLDDMKPRYPGAHMSTNAWVHTPGIP